MPSVTRHLLLPDLAILYFNKHQYVVLGLLSLPTLYFVWRLWVFTVAPALKSNEPKPLPYRIPLLGHTWLFMNNAEKLFHSGYKYFQSGEPFAICLGGRKVVIIRSVQDVAYLWKHTTALTFDPFTRNVMDAFGITPSAKEKMFHDDPASLIREELKPYSLLINANHSQKCYVHLQSDWFKLQLHPGEMLNQFQNKFLNYVKDELHWKTLSPYFILSSGQEEMVISLRKYCRHIISAAANKTFFGDSLFHVDPSFQQNYYNYEDDSWKVFFNYPRFMAKELHLTKERTIKGMMDYLAQPQEQRSDLAWLFQNMDSELTNLGLGAHDRASMIMLIVWGINNNTHYICFWILAHVVCNPTLLSALRDETNRTCAADGSVDLEALFTDCPHLDALWYETLRVYTAVSVVRHALSPVTVGGKAIHQGDQVMGPFRQFHLNSTTFGGDALEFDPERFLVNKGLSRAKGYAPFGGGSTYCPGRFFARREIYMFIALTLFRFDLSLVLKAGSKTQEENIPKVDLQTPSPAATRPLGDVVVKMKPRAYSN